MGLTVLILVFKKGCGLPIIDVEHAPHRVAGQELRWDKTDQPRRTKKNIL